MQQLKVETELDKLADVQCHKGSSLLPSIYRHGNLCSKKGKDPAPDKLSTHVNASPPDQSVLLENINRCLDLRGILNTFKQTSASEGNAYLKQRLITKSFCRSSQMCLCLN